MFTSNSILETAIVKFFEIIEIFIFARILLMLIIRDHKNPIVSFLYQITEPILEPFRKLIAMLPFNTGMFDFSPLLALLVINFIERILLNIL